MDDSDMNESFLETGQHGDSFYFDDTALDLEDTDDEHESDADESCRYDIRFFNYVLN